MVGSLGQEGRSLLFNHWQPSDKSGIKSRRAIAAGEISTSPLPDELGGHASTFVRRERGRAARASSDACSSRIQFDQPASELAGTAAQVKYAGEHLLLKAIYQRWICQQAGERAVAGVAIVIR